MTEQPAPYQPNPSLKRVERGFERMLFNSRWLMAPFYLGLVISLAVLLLKFGMVLWEFILHAPGSKESDIILGVLSLIDLSLTGNLILIVVFSGYENFVSKIDPAGHPDWPDWMTKIQFGGLKQKLLASIVAISAIQVLKAFMNIDTTFDPNKLGWLVGVHLVFVVSAAVLALSDHGGEQDLAEVIAVLGDQDTSQIRPVHALERDQVGTIVNNSDVHRPDAKPPSSRAIRGTMVYLPVAPWKEKFREIAFFERRKENALSREVFRNYLQMKGHKID